jgi:uracil-DNA glycosylase family 4
MDYSELVKARKSCNLCVGLTNPSKVLNGAYDSKQIGPWSRWQGNLNSKILIVGQDWGGISFFENNMGLEPLRNKTNDTLVQLLNSIGITVKLPNGRDTIGEVFLTNAILCLKDGNLQAPVQSQWFTTCGKRFLRPLIDLMCPKILIALGEMAYSAICNIYNIHKLPFKVSVEADKGSYLPGGTNLFPRYHCGARILNTHRPLKKQLTDWGKLKKYLD